jgi:putative ABC transport system substrate-binding protein
VFDLKRRDFIALLGGAAAACPLAAHGQQRAKMRRIGMLNSQSADEVQSQARHAAFLQGLSELGWNVGRNLQIDYRWGKGEFQQYPRYAAELLALSPEAVLAVGAAVVGPLLVATRDVPIVFLQVTDPVGSGYVASLARPGGNATGFTLFEFGNSVKWLELLKDVAPTVTRVAVLGDPRVPSGLGMLGALQSAASISGVELVSVGMRDVPDMERGLAAFMRGSQEGLIVLPSAPTMVYREQIIARAARNKLPAIYPYRWHTASGGLLSYGPDEIEQHRQAAGYIDRILRGEKPADLPVQAPTKYELVINLKTAKALGLKVPPTLLAIADEVIE